ncbi:MAG: serine/threonine-protein kinase [Cyanobacteria bacterium P01_A01_bin.45]
MSHIKNTSAIHCVNPECHRPYPQLWGSRFCSTCGAPLHLLNRYVPLQKLGSGGFAQIYTIWDEKTQTEKVLKVLVECSLKAQELFSQEASVLISLRHPGVPKVESDGYFQRHWGNSGGQKSLPCLVMEKIDGQTLEEVKKQYPQGCPQDLVLDWLNQSIEILDHLHQRKIIHRDIKPSNLMLRNPSPSPVAGKYALGGQIVLIDFGGVKQFTTAINPGQPRSTRLFSTGYSPPEQIVGSKVGPAADFYALSRTMIELLTSHHPQDLEDSVTGKIYWRHLVNINPYLGDLLDEMAHEDVRSRPQTAAIVQKRLAKIFQLSINSGFAQNQQSSTTTKVNPTISLTAPPRVPLFLSQIEQFLVLAVTNFAKTVSITTLTTFKAIFNLVQAFLYTIWAMFLTSLGAFIGTIAGFILAFRTNFGSVFTQYISSNLQFLLPNAQSVTASEVLLFATAGLGTAWGLTAAGVFGQKRRYLVASIMGIIGYTFGWVVMQFMIPVYSSESIIVMILSAVSLLTLGLGLRTHHIVHAIITSFGTAIPFALFIQLGWFPKTIFNFNNISLWSNLLLPIFFFVLVGIFISLFLGISYYLIVPGLRFLGWRS